MADAESYRHPRRDEYLSALRFWKACASETRRPCPPDRDELLDSWHTLLMAKTISAMMFPDRRNGAGVARIIALALLIAALYARHMAVSR